jgi:hypothetical protein
MLNYLFDSILESKRVIIYYFDNELTQYNIDIIRYTLERYIYGIMVL